MPLTFDEIMSAEDAEITKLDVPEWGGEVWMRGMSGDSRDRIETLHVAGSEDNPEKLIGYRASVVAACLCDENGEHLVLTGNQIRQLGSKNGKVIDRLFAVARRISGMGPEAIEDAAKNSDSAPSE